jgi:predicted enzyme related to lactoylglutathione lyase
MIITRAVVQGGTSGGMRDEARSGIVPFLRAMGIQRTMFILYVADQERSTAFYAGVLERTAVLHVPGMTEFLLNDGCKLGLMPDPGIARIVSGPLPHPSKGTGIPRCELYLMVDDVEVALARAIAAGAQLVSPAMQRDWGHLVAYAADADGHVIAFATE